MFRSLVAALALAATTFAAAAADKDFLYLELKSGTVKIELLDEIAPNHVDRVIALSDSGSYDGIAFHRVIDGFMAQTGDVKYGRVAEDGSVSDRAGVGGSDMPDVAAEFSEEPFERGTVGAARTQDPNTANSQFFIMFDRSPGLDRNYTVWGRVVEGMEHVDSIKRGSRAHNGKVVQPDRIIRAWTE